MSVLKIIFNIKMSCQFKHRAVLVIRTTFHESLENQKSYHSANCSYYLEILGTVQFSLRYDIGRRIFSFFSQQANYKH